MKSCSFSEIAKNLFFHFKFSLFFFFLAFLVLFHSAEIIPMQFSSFIGALTETTIILLFYTALNFILFHTLGYVSLTAL